MSGQELEGARLLGYLGVALAIGLLVGLERGWERRELGEGKRAAGLRTFGMIGLIGGATIQFGTPSTRWQWSPRRSACLRRWVTGVNQIGTTM
jgi:hypothetical protein